MRSPPEQRQHAHRGCSSRRARSATTRMSSPGSSRPCARAGSRRRSRRARTRRASRRRCRSSRGRRRRRAPPRRGRRRRPRGSGSRARLPVAAARPAGSPPPRLARAQSGGTQSASISAPSRWAERHARRRMRCDLGCGSISARIRSPTACLLSGSRIAGWRRASTSSATSRSTSSRSAARFSWRKKFSSATSARSRE